MLLPLFAGVDGISSDLVAVLTLRDRSGKAAEKVAHNSLLECAKTLFINHIKQDSLLLTDGCKSLSAAAKKTHRSTHICLKGARSRGGKSTPYHLQNVNSYHSHLKRWMTRFNGVATKYLHNYAAWHRHLNAKTHRNDPNAFISLSVKGGLYNQQLMQT